MKIRAILLVPILIWFFVSSFDLQAQGDIFQKLNTIAMFDQKIIMPIWNGDRLVKDIHRTKTDQKITIISNL